MDELKDKIINIPVEDILPNRFQPRLEFDENELNELSNSIIKYGVIQPIVVRQIGEKYEIIAGERRYKASVLAGLKTIPAIINNTDDNTSAEIALLENLQRKNLTVIEEAQSFKKLLDRGFTQEEIATKLGISQSSIANKIRLLNLPRKVQDALLYNKISERHARSLLSLNNSELQLDLLNKIISEKLTVKQTEEEISNLIKRKDDSAEIPDEIKKIINDDHENIKDEIKENTTYNGLKFIQEIPDVVNIDDDENDNDDEQINPFQIKFEDNIKRINEEIENKPDDYYNSIINNDINKNNYKNDNLEMKEENINNNLSSEIPFIDNIDNEKAEDLDDLSSDNSLPNTIVNIRKFINNMNNKNIVINELDLPDKYQITIDIKKD